MNCRYSILHHPQQLKPHDRLPIWCVLVEPMEGLPSFCLSRLSHRRSPTFKTSLVSDTIVRKGAVLRQLMRERPKSSSTEVHIKQKLLSVFYPLTNYTYSVHDSVRNVKCFIFPLESKTYRTCYSILSLDTCQLIRFYHLPVVKSGGLWGNFDDRL